MLRRLEPIAELPSIIIELEMLQHKRERAHRWVISGKLVMIKIQPRGLVIPADIDHDGIGIRDVGLRGFATRYWDGILIKKKGTR
jgi:hypothetical protein